MRQTLSKYSGYYQSVPNAILHFLPEDEKALFLLINELSKQPLFDGMVDISTRTIEDVIGFKAPKVAKLIDSLEALNIVHVIVEHRKTTKYQINWDEIGLIHDCFRTITYEGQHKIRTACLRTNTPFSQLSSKTLEEITSAHTFTPETTKNGSCNQNTDDESATILNNIANLVADGVDNQDESATIFAKIIKMVADECDMADKTATILNKTAVLVADKLSSATKNDKNRKMVADENAQTTESATILKENAILVADETISASPSATKTIKNAEMVAVVCNEASHFFDSERVLNVQLSNAETLLVDLLGADNITVRFLSATNLKKNAILVADATKLLPKSISSATKTQKNDEKSLILGALKDNIENIRKNELTERSEVSYIGEEKIEEDLEEGFEGLEVVELKEEEPFKKIDVGVGTSQVHTPYINKPYFSTRVIEDITYSADNCESPVELYIYNLWKGLFDLYLNDTDKDFQEEHEEDNSNIDNLDMIGWMLPVEDLFRAGKLAWEETCGDIEKGYAEFEGKRIQLRFTDTLPDNFNPVYLTDWEITQITEEHSMAKVVIDKFRNIMANDVQACEENPKASREQKKADNKKNREYMLAISKASKDKLTDLEIAIQAFIRAFLKEQDERYMGFLNGKGAEIGCTVLPAYMIQEWNYTKFQELQIAVSLDDLYSVFNLQTTYKGDTDIQWVNTLISAKKAKRWHELHGMTSQLLP